jgi:2-(1,2-epoxy-1,2-dihydrophenyl)acetyl-CoA isomerase
MALIESEHLLVEVKDKVAILTFNQPEKLNALSWEMNEAAVSHLEKFADDPGVGCIVVTGAGRAFCAGGDVSSMGSRGGVGGSLTYEDNINQQLIRHQFPWLLHRIPKVTIAAVNGHAMGAGLGIALCCDLRLAAPTGKFGTAFAKVGLGGDYGTTWQLTRLVGEAKAKELFILGDIIDAEEGKRIGLVNRILDGDSFMDEVTEIAKKIANGPLVSFRYMKENVNLSQEQDFKSILDREALTHLRCGQTDDHKEGIKAFAEKRDPVFQGR